MSGAPARGVRRGVAATALGAVLVVAAGCGGGGAPLTSGAARDLSARVAAVRQAAVAHDADAAHRGLTTLRLRVAALRRGDEISGERAAAVLAAAAGVDADLDLVTTTTVTTTTTTAPVRPVKPTKPENPGKGKGQGKE
jgi:hypothetical protein